MLAESIIKVATEKNSELIFPDKLFQVSGFKFDDDLNINISLNTSGNYYEGLKINLSGKHQLDNIKLAIAALDKLKNDYTISKTNIRNGLKNIRKNTGLKGRIELLRKVPPLILDVAHNPGGITALTETILDSPYFSTKFNIIFGAMKDKNIQGMLQSLLPIYSKMFFTVPQIERAATLDHLETAAKIIGIENYYLIEKPLQALKNAIELNEPIIIVGSFYLVGDLVEELAKLQHPF